MSTSGVRKSKAKRFVQTCAVLYVGAIAGVGGFGCKAHVRASDSTVLDTQGPKAPGAIQRVIVISMDGMMPGTYLQPEQHGVTVPTLRKLVQQGASSDGVRSVFPSVTYPSHTSMVTGVNPSRHGITSNRTFDPLDNDLESWRWYAEEIKAKPVWRAAEEAGYETAMVHWPVSLGAQVHWLLPEFWRARNVQDQKLMRIVSTPHLLDDVASEHADFWSRYVPPDVSDDALTDVALHILKVGKPRLLFLHLVEIDGAQHRHGIGSAEARAAIEGDDHQLARILQQLEDLNLTHETAVIVLSDHGFRNVTRMVRPCVLLKNAGFVDVGLDGKTKDWRASVLVNGGQAYVYLKDPSDKATRASVRALFVQQQSQPESGIGQIYSADEIRARGGDGTAFLSLEPSGTTQFGPGCTGDYVATGGYKGTHGFDPGHPEMRASMLIAGPGIVHGKIIDAHLIDVAPTIAQWLGLQLGPVDGVPLRIVAE